MEAEALVDIPYQTHIRQNQSSQLKLFQVIKNLYNNLRPRRGSLQLLIKLIFDDELQEFAGSGLGVYQSITAKRMRDINALKIEGDAGVINIFDLPFYFRGLYLLIEFTSCHNP